LRNILLVFVAILSASSGFWHGNSVSNGISDEASESRSIALSLLFRSFVLFACNFVGEFWPLAPRVLLLVALGVVGTLLLRLAVLLLLMTVLLWWWCALACRLLVDSLPNGSFGLLPTGVTVGDFSGVLLGVVACECDCDVVVVVLICRWPFEFDGFREALRWSESEARTRK
jgi:hypothetical protein